jgi:cytochrome P450
MKQGTTRQEEPLNLYDDELAAHPQALYRTMRETCPVVPGQTADGKGGGKVIVGYEDVLFALRHPEIFSSSIEAAYLGNVRPLIPLQKDPPEHTNYRRILDPLLSRKQTLKLEPAIRQVARSLVDGFAERGECEFNAAFAIPYPSTVFLGLMGLPKEDLKNFLKMKDDVIRPRQGTPDEVRQVRCGAGERIYSYFEKVLIERRGHPADDLLSQLAGPLSGGEQLSHEELLDICYLFLIGGLDTVTASLGCSMVYLANNPEKRRALVKDKTLIPSAVEELLRWETPVMGVSRIATRDTEIGGQPILAGEQVTLLLGSADTDGAEFKNADLVDLGRNPNRHLAFSAGPHRCLGSHLARLELRIALEEFHERIPEYRIKPGEKPVYGLGIREVKHLPLVFSSEPATQSSNNT